MEKYKFTKDDTWAIKGIAIIFMYWHHCFLDKSRFEGCFVDFFPLSENVAIYIAAFFKICVGMFAFMSAYGITVSTRQRYSDICLGKKDTYISVFSRWFSLMQGWLFVFIICEVITFFIDRRPLEIYGGGTKGIINFFIDMLGLADLFQTPLLIATWWYMSLAICIIIVMPILLLIYKKIGLLLILLMIVLPKGLGLDITNMIRWMLALGLGIVFAEKNVFERVKGWVYKNNTILKSAALAVLLILLVMFRQSRMGGQFIYILDGVVPAYVILLSYVYIIAIPYVRPILILLGKHSMNMFLIHNFIRVIYLYEWTYSFRYAIIDVLVLLFETVLLSMLLEKAKEILGYNMICGKIKKSIVRMIDSRCI